MQTSASRFVIAALLGATILSAPAHAGWFSSSKDDDKSARSGAKVEDRTQNTPKPAETLDGSIMQAQMLRLAGNYPEAIKHLSQLMMVASDDGRVVSEYGKTLAAMGRAQESVSFLTRAQQLQPGDWSVYSALGVAYDQIGKQAEADQAYERALTLKPGEPSVLNNYALSRMLAKDPEGAKKLMARAEIAGGASDEKIARNIKMVRELAPEAPEKDFAVNTPAPAPVPHVARAALPQAVARQEAPAMAPRQLQPANTGIIEAPPQQMMAQQVRPAGVVMQRVPVDPLAGPVESKITMAQAPRAPKAKTPAVEKPVAEKPVASIATQAGPKTAAAAANDLQAKADAIAKQLAGKPQAIAAAKAEASKPEASKPEATKAPAAVAQAKPQPVKAAETKPAAPQPAPKPAQPTKVAAAAPKPADKNAVPALRMSANAY